MSSDATSVVPIIIPFFCADVKEGADVGEAAGQLDPLEQPLWQPWQGRQYSSVLPQYLSTISFGSLNSGDVIDIGSPPHPYSLQQPLESEGSQSALPNLSHISRQACKWRFARLWFETGEALRATLSPSQST